MAVQTPVLIVGGGPVGLALAGDLGWRGVPCVLVEKSDGVIEHPRMDLVGVRTMEFCRRWGIADWVRDAPYPNDYPQDCVYLTGLNGYELGRERFPGRGSEQLPPQSPQKRERVPQDMFDPILKRFAESLPEVTLRYRQELVAFIEEPRGVRAVLRNAGNGDTDTVTADYLIGADGGSSTVREVAGIRMSGKPALTYTTNVMFRCPNFTALHDKGRAYRFMFIGPEGLWLTIVAINGSDRFRMSIVGSPEKVTYGTPDIHDALRRAMGRDFDYEILSVLPWVRRELVADTYGAGRVFLAGDAAHMMSPTGGLGMNTGIGDAADLGWKLDASLRGWGGDALPNSYERERRPVALRNVAQSTGNLQRMLSTRQKRPPSDVFEGGLEGEAARAIYGAWFTETMRHEWFTVGFHLGYRYDDSPIVWPDGTPPPPEATSTYVQTARPGARAPHLWLADGRSTLDLFGHGFTLLQLGASDRHVDLLRGAAELRGVPLRVVHLDTPEMLAAYDRRLILVRPDGHVAWRGNVAPDDPVAVIDVARGARAYADMAEDGVAAATP